MREEDPNQYTIPKKHGNEPTNYTSFLQKDKEFGPERDNRSHVLFRIKNAKPPTEKPTAYVIDDNRIVLDAYDHGLRDFPNVLPKVLSSELEGHDIEYYYRQNADIADYDLIARMPHAFHYGNEDNIAAISLREEAQSTNVPSDFIRGQLALHGITGPELVSRTLLF